MATYLITGVSRGIGFEFLRQISSDPANTVVGLVRDKTGTEKKVAAELSDRKNIHIVQADLTKYDEIKRSVDETSKITGGSVDYLIANAALISTFSGFDSFGTLGATPEELENDLLECYKINVIGNVHLFNLYVPLVLKGSVKKVVVLSSGLADADLTAQYKLTPGGPYSASKAAMNLVTAKYSAEYSDQGVLFLSISPGMVETGQSADFTPEQSQKLQGLVGKFLQYAPDFKGPISTEESVKAVMSVVDKSSVQNGDGGAFISHLGTKRWI